MESPELWHGWTIPLMKQARPVEPIWLCALIPVQVRRRAAKIGSVIWLEMRSEMVTLGSPVILDEEVTSMIARLGAGRKLILRSACPLADSSMAVLEQNALISTLPVRVSVVSGLVIVLSRIVTGPALGGGKSDREMVLAMGTELTARGTDDIVALTLAKDRKEGNFTNKAPSERIPCKYVNVRLQVAVEPTVKFLGARLMPVMGDETAPRLNCPANLAYPFDLTLTVNGPAASKDGAMITLLTTILRSCPWGSSLLRPNYTVLSEVPAKLMANRLLMLTNCRAGEQEVVKSIRKVSVGARVSGRARLMLRGREDEVKGVPRVRPCREVNGLSVTPAGQTKQMLTGRPTSAQDSILMKSVGSSVGGLRTWVRLTDPAMSESENRFVICTRGQRKLSVPPLQVTLIDQVVHIVTSVDEQGAAIGNTICWLAVSRLQEQGRVTQRKQLLCIADPELTDMPSVAVLLPKEPWKSALQREKLFGLMYTLLRPQDCDVSAPIVA